MSVIPSAEHRTPLVIYDTMAARKKPLELLEPGRCRIYCCGPTVYDSAHVGHAFAALVPDMLVRLLRSEGITVTYARNVTDIDDKIITRAHAEGVEPEVIAQRYLDEYHADLAALGMLTPDVEPRVTQNITPVIALIGRLVENGMAYPVEGDVYFRVERFAPYGALSKRQLDDLRAGARIEVDERKENPLDFAVWKAAKPGEPSWPSPWGNGRPGWHIECSAMSTTCLGTAFDVHTGGRDLIFPHHENEIAQFQGVYGEHTYARNWIHNGFINFAGEKMSKSLGNFFTVGQVLASYEPEVLRYFLLGAHYRSAVNLDVSVHCPSCKASLSTEAQCASACPHCAAAYDDAALRKHVRFPGLDEAEDRLTYVYETLLAARSEAADAEETQPERLSGPLVGWRESFRNAMLDDLNSAAALATLSEPLSEVNRLLASKSSSERELRARCLRRFLTDIAYVSSVLGVFGRDPATWLGAKRDKKAERLGVDVARIEHLVAERRRARAQKDWEAADRVRDELRSMGVTVRDATDRSTWTL